MSIAAPYVHVPYISRSISAGALPYETLVDSNVTGSIFWIRGLKGMPLRANNWHIFFLHRMYNYCGSLNDGTSHNRALGPVHAVMALTCMENRAAILSSLVFLDGFYNESAGLEPYTFRVVLVVV